jgi:pSer/pThr/pTyr-binding forkhead associated (FHA) protein
MIMSLILRIISGLSEQTDFPLQKKVIIIGRDMSNDIVINNSKISRRHAKLTVSEKGNCFIEDLDSAYGTYIHGKKITKKIPLNYGSTVSLGENIKFELLNPDDLKDQDISRPTIEKEPRGEPIVEVGLNESINSSNESISQKDERFFYWKKFLSIDALKRLPTWALVTLIALLFVVIFCLIPLLIIELTNQWCTLFSGFFNSIRPGLCPF